MKFLVLSLVLAAFGIQAAEVEKKIDLTKSTIEWTGSKLVGKHDGNLKFKSGSLKFKDGKLAGGEFVVDMDSLSNKDLKGALNEQLVKHLKSADFFDVGKHKEASLKISSVKDLGKGEYDVEAKLKIKGKENTEKFKATVVGEKATAALTFDRTVYELHYGSGKFFKNLGDKVINDEIGLKVNVVAP